MFRIVNERTRHVAENPVEKALRLGTIVGLANHTMLLREDGAEFLIDDSAAPIRNKDGSLFGVVWCSVMLLSNESYTKLGNS